MVLNKTLMKKYSKYLPGMLNGNQCLKYSQFCIINDLRNRFVLLSLAVFVVIIACENQNAKSNSNLLYWSSNNPYEIEFAESIVKKWNAENPDHRVQSQPVPEGRSSEEVILAAVVGKTTPDIYSNMWQGDVEFYARSGVLVQLDTLYGFMEVLRQRCDNAVIDEITSSDGHIYQVPWKINPIMLIYNKNLLKKIGFENPPATYSEFLEAGKRSQKDTDGDGYIDRWIGYSEVLVTWWQRFFDFYPLYLASSGGGKLVDDNKVLFNNDHAVQVFKFLRKLYEKNYFSQELLSARQDVFIAEIIATRFTGPWEIVHAEKFKAVGFEYDFSPMPVPDNLEDKSEISYTYGDPKNIVIFNTCKNPQAAWNFIKNLISIKGDIKLLQFTNQLPRRKNLFSDSSFVEYFQNNPRMIPFAKQAKYVRGTDVCPVLKEVFDIISQEYEACVIYGVKSAEQAVNDAAKAAQLLLN